MQQQHNLYKWFWPNFKPHNTYQATTYYNTGVAMCRPCKPGPTTFIESKKNKEPKNVIKNEGQWCEGWGPTNLDIKELETISVHTHTQILLLVQSRNSADKNIRCR